MSIVINNIEVIAKKLKAEFDIQTSSVEHNLLKGTMREDSLKEALRDIIPIKYEFGSGILVDAKGTQSKQQDFILYDAFSSPAFLRKQKDLVLPIESVYATIEVKSTLTNAELEKAVKNFQSAMELEKNTIKSFLPITGNNSIMGLVFAYTSNTSLDSLTNKLVELNSEIAIRHRIGCVCVLDKGNIVNVQRDDLGILHTLPSEKTTLQIKENTLEQNLYLFYLLLQSHLNHALNLPPDLWKYAKTSGDYLDKGIIMPLSTITDDLVIPIIEGVEISGAEYKRYWKMHEYIYKGMTGTLTDEDVIKSGMKPEEFTEELTWAIKFMSETRKRFFNSNKKEESMHSADESDT